MEVRLAFVLSGVGGRSAARVGHGTTTFTARRGALRCPLRRSCCRSIVPRASSSSSSSSSTSTKAKLEDVESAGSLQNAIEIFDKLKNEGDVKLWANQKLSVRPVSQGELKMNTKLDGETLGVTNSNVTDLRVAFYAVIGVSSALAVLCQIVFTGQLAYFSSYIIGGTSIAFLAVGSTNPGLLSGLITLISSQVRPNYKERLLKHEAGHFLAGYLCGVPVRSYDINPITTAVQFYGTETLNDDVSDGVISRPEIDALSVVALAGPVAEAIQYERAEGGMADLRLLQGLFLRTSPSLRSKEQQEQTRWSALMAYTVIRKYKAQYDALLSAMRQRKSVAECIRAIESAPLPS